MRVTNSMISTTVVGNLSASQSRMLELQNQVSSGKRFSKASQDPTGTSRSLDLRSSLSNIEQYKKNIEEARARLHQMDTTLGSITKTLQEAKRIGLFGVTSTADEPQRRQMADQLQHQIDSILLDINAKHLDRHLYSGHQTGTVPVTVSPEGASPYRYNGDDGVSSVQVSESVRVEVNLTAKQILNFDGAADPALPDVLSILSGMKEDLRAGNTDGIQKRIQQLDDSFQNILSIRGATGYKAMQMELYADRMAETQISVGEWLSKEEDVDIAEALTRLQMEQNVYQASLISTSRIIQPSLADFLR